MYVFVLLIHSPWYNHTGWLGVKHQITYLLTYLHIYLLCLFAFAFSLFVYIWSTVFYLFTSTLFLLICVVFSYFIYFVCLSIITLFVSLHLACLFFSCFIYCDCFSSSALFFLSIFPYNNNSSTMFVLLQTLFLFLCFSTSTLLLSLHLSFLFP